MKVYKAFYKRAQPDNALIEAAFNVWNSGWVWNFQTKQPQQTQVSLVILPMEQDQKLRIFFESREELQSLIKDLQKAEASYDTPCPKGLDDE